MAEVKLTKNELRTQQIRLSQLQKYLPTLKLKKAILQADVNDVRIEILSLEETFHEMRLIVSHSSSLLSEKVGLDFTKAAKVERIEKKYENIAGVEVPILESVIFASFEYSLLTTPTWLDAVVADLRKMAIARAKVFLGDQELAAVAQAKVAKEKIEQRKKKKQVA